MKIISMGACGIPARLGARALKAVTLLSIVALSMTLGAPDAAARNYTFSAIAVEGNQRIESSSIVSYSGLRNGQTVSDGQVNDAYQNLVHTGLFQSVAVIPDGHKLVIRVVEFPTISRISFEGNKRLNDEALTGIIKSEPRRVYNPADAEHDATLIVDTYRMTGRMAARVKPVIIRRPDNRVDLIFEIREGSVTEIERLSFVGNRSFSDTRLRRVLQTKQAGIFRRLINSDTFVADRIDFDKQMLTDFYNSRGYVDFRILSVASEFPRERDGFFLTFRLQEGQAFDFGQITTVSDLAGIDPDEFQSVLKIHPGVTYSPALVDRAIARMERLAIEKGLDFIRVEPRVTRNDAALTLDLEFNIIQGKRVFIERIDIAGNATTLDRVIRRQFRVVEGDPFNPREIRQAGRRIRALDFFETADVTTSEGSSPDLQVVDVKVVEKFTGELSIGLSFSTDNGPGIGTSFQEANFLGRGQFIRASVNVAENATSLDFDFREPAFLDRDVTLGLRTFFTFTNNQDNASFDTNSIGFSPSLEFPINDNSRFGVHYLISRDDIQNINAANSPILQREEGTKVTSAIGYTYTMDTRTSGLDPDAGVILRFSGDVAGLGGDVKYLRAVGLVGAERRLRGDLVTLSVEVEGGALHMLRGRSRLTDRFFLSSEQMRGFAFRGIGPRDTASAVVDGLGGEFYAVTRFEAKFPIGLPEEYGVRGGVFLDVGSVWGLEDTAGAGITPVDDSFSLRSSAGFSIFWKSALGPLRFNFAKTIAKRATDETRVFDMTVATRF